LLRAKAMLLPGVKFTLGIEKKGKITTQTWHFPEGIKGYFDAAIAGAEPVADSFFGERYIAAQSESDSFAEGEGAMWAIAWTPESDLVTESYVNMIPTRQGGTHVSGLREGVYNAIKNFIDIHAMGQRGLKVVPEDVWSRANFVLSVKMLDPQFKGQVKNELISRDAVKLVAQMVRDPSIEWPLAAFLAAFFLFVAAVIYPAGMGMGDVKLALLMGAALGKVVSVALIIGMVSAVIPGLYLLARHGRSARKMGVPFAPFLALGSVIALFAGEWLLEAYLGVLRS
jgi:prepilin signal peptidase PulO-like enzyme (type II secretory pathway)